MEEYISVLAAVPAEMPESMRRRMEDLFHAVYSGNDVRTQFVFDSDNFNVMFHARPYELVVCFDDIRFGSSYARMVGGNGYSRKMIVVVPDECMGDAILMELIQMGITEIVFQKDFNLSSIRGLVRYGRTRDEAMGYCGVDLRPVRSAQHPDVYRQVEEETKPSNSIKRKYIGEGIAVTQLLAQDARLLKKDGIDDDAFDLTLFSGYEMTEEEHQGVMPLRTYPVDEDWVDACKEELKKRFVRTQLAFYKEYESGKVSDSEFREKVRIELLHLRIHPERIPSITDSFIRDIKSYGKLDVLVHDKNVSDIRLLDKDTINVQSRGEWYRTNITFRTESEYETFILHLCTKNNVPFNLTSADVVFPDENSFPGEAMTRISATYASLNVSRKSSAHIRITRKEKKNAGELIQDGFMNVKEASFLANKFRQKKSVLICGGSGAGKTVLFNCMLEYWPRAVCGELVQESSELFAPHHLNIKVSNSIENTAGDSKADHSLKALARTALLRNTEVYGIGEIKGDEAASFYTASRTTAVYSSTHSDDCFGAIPRIAELALAAGAGNTKEEVMRVLSGTIDTVVYCEKYQVKQIAEVKGWVEDKKDILYHLYDFNAKEGE